MEENRLRELRIEKNISGTEIADFLNISPQYYYDLEKGKRRLNVDLAEKIASFYGVTIDYLLCRTDIRNPMQINEVHPADADMVMLPVLGDIRAGRPLFAQEHYQGEMPFPKKMLTSGFEHFLLNVQGDSMIGDNIQPGDVVLIRVQNYIDYEGQIAAVIIDGDEACLKHVFHPARSNMIILRSSNPAYADIVHSAEDVIINGVYAGVFKAPKR